QRVATGGRHDAREHTGAQLGHRVAYHAAAHGPLEEHQLACGGAGGQSHRVEDGGAVVALGLFAYGIPAAVDPNPDVAFNIGWGNVVIYALTIPAGLYVAFNQTARDARPVSTGDTER